MDFQTTQERQHEVGYDIVYMDETWVNQNHCTCYMWLPNDGSDDPKIPSGKGKRLIVLSNTTRLGFFRAGINGFSNHSRKTTLFISW
jgi:hypothetical protein